MSGHLFFIVKWSLAASCYAIFVLAYGAKKGACCHRMTVGSTLNELGYAALLSNEYCQNTATVTLN